MDRGTVVVAGSRVRLVEEHGGRVARLLMAAPPDNAIDLQASNELLAALGALERWPVLAALVLEGEGRDFSAGFGLSHRRMPYLDALLPQHHAACLKLLELPVVRLAAVRGRCEGAALELALCCHLVLCDPTAKFALPEARLGAFPTVAPALLPARVGEGRAAEWTITGRAVPADEAAAARLVDACASGWDGVDSLVARHVAEHVLARPLAATRAMARSLSLDAVERVRALAPQTERLLRDHVAGSAEHEEGISAALRGRAPRWAQP